MRKPTRGLFRAEKPQHGNLSTKSGTFARGDLNESWICPIFDLRPLLFMALCHIFLPETALLTPADAGFFVFTWTKKHYM